MIKEPENDKTLPILDERSFPYETNSTRGINTPEIAPPAFNPPVPNRAWTALRNGMDIEELSEDEKRELYLGNDNML